MLIKFDRRAYEQRVVGKYSAIRQNREHSRQILSTLETRLATLARRIPASIQTVAICGSYARLEASQESDLDVLTITKSTDVDSMRQHLEEIMREMGLPQPNPKGVFAGSAPVDGLLSAIGSRDETYADLSRRLLLLLESRPIFRAPGYRKLINDIVDKYAEDITLDQNKNFVFLINDLIRFFRTLCVNYQYTRDEEWGKWPIRNVKLRHSRVLLYFSLPAPILFT